MPCVPRISARIVAFAGGTRSGSWAERTAVAANAAQDAAARRTTGEGIGRIIEWVPTPVPRPLLIIFLTIFVNLIGFGIIIPLLPFYAERFGASPVAIGLLFAVFSICQLVAAPVLG